MNQQEHERLIKATIEALNGALEPAGARFDYDEETMGLALSRYEDADPNWQGVINDIVVMVATLFSCAFEISQFTTREQPLVSRHQELHRVFMSIGDLLGSAYEGAAQDAAGDIELLSPTVIKH